MNEISKENLSALEKKYQTTSLIIVSQIFFTIVLVIIGWFYAANVENAISDESLTALRVGVIFIAITTFVLRRMLIRWDRLKNISLLKGIPGLLNSLQTNAIILGTMAEIIAIIGFLIATLGGIKTDMLTFGAVALVLFLINFPRKSIWEKIVANLEKI
jgi:hypothetical protein